MADVVDADRLESRALEAAEQISALAPWGVRLTKQGIWAALEIPSEQAAVEYEDRQQIMATFGARSARGDRRVPREAPGRVRRLTMSDLFDVSGKTALVTGGSRGIGRMIATGLLGAGARVVISSRKAEDLEQTAARAFAARRVPRDPGGCLAPRGRRCARRLGAQSLRRPRHPRQQRRRHLGRAARGVPRLGLGPGDPHQRRGHLPSHRRAAPGAAPRLPASTIRRA